MSRTVKVSQYATAATAIAHSLTFTDTTNVIAIQLHLSAAPTTSENLTVALNSNAAAAYDTNLLTIDLAAYSATDLVFMPGRRFVAGDAIDIAYTNTDARTHGLTIYYDESANPSDFGSCELWVNGQQLSKDTADMEALLTTIDADTGAMVTDLAALEVLVTAGNVDLAAIETLITAGNVDLAAIEVLLGTIDADTGNIATSTATVATDSTNLRQGLVGIPGTPFTPLAFTGASARTASGLTASTEYLFCSTEDCYFTFGDGACTATTSSVYLPAKTPVPFTTPASDTYVAALRVAVDGTLHMCPLT